MSRRESRAASPMLYSEAARTLLDSIDADDIVGLLDRSLIGAVFISSAWSSAALGMKVEDYYT